MQLLALLRGGNSDASGAAPRPQVLWSWPLGLLSVRQAVPVRVRARQWSQSCLMVVFSSRRVEAYSRSALFPVRMERADRDGNGATPLSGSRAGAAQGFFRKKARAGSPETGGRVTERLVKQPTCDW